MCGEASNRIGDQAGLDRWSIMKMRRVGADREKGKAKVERCHFLDTPHEPISRSTVSNKHIIIIRHSMYLSFYL